MFSLVMVRPMRPNPLIANLGLFVVIFSLQERGSGCSSTARYPAELISVVTFCKSAALLWQELSVPVVEQPGSVHFVIGLGSHSCAMT